LKQLDGWIAANTKTPEWITNPITERVNELEAQLKANAWKRIGGAAPGDPHE